MILQPGANNVTITAHMPVSQSVAEQLSTCLVVMVTLQTISFSLLTPHHTQNNSIALQSKQSLKVFLWFPEFQAEPLATNHISCGTSSGSGVRHTLCFQARCKTFLFHKVHNQTSGNGSTTHILNLVILRQNKIFKTFSRKNSSYAR